MRFNDAVIGLVLVIVGALVIWHTRTFPAMPGQDYGPALFPRLLASGLIIGGVMLVVSGLRAKMPLLQRAAWTRSPHFVYFLSVPAALLFYILFSDALGFLLVASLVLAALMALYRRGHVVSSALIAAAATLVIQQAFSRLLLVPLPRGVIENLIG